VEKKGRYSCCNDLIIEKEELLANKRVITHVVGHVGKKYRAIIAQAEDEASQ
jgi:hypothetical protein